MKDVLEQAQEWQKRGEQVALATVTWTSGSTPRPVGAKMAVNARGQFVGSVSGGCVEGAVIDEAQNVLKSGAPKLISYGIADEQAWDVGLACGGSIKVFIEKIT